MAHQPPNHADAMLFMEYYKIWDTPADIDAWSLLRRLKAEGALEHYQTFRSRVPAGSREDGLIDRLCRAFEQAGVLMRHGLLHPDLYFDSWADPTSTWTRLEPVVMGLRQESAAPDLFRNFEWLAAQAIGWREEQAENV